MAAFALISMLGLSGVTLTLLLTLIMFLTLTIYIYFAFYKQSDRVMELVNKIPGPKCYPIIGSAYVFGTDPKDILQNVSVLANQYSGLSRHWIGPILYIGVHNPIDIEVVLSSSSLITKSHALDMMKDAMGDGLVLSTGEKWKKHRKLLQPAFHTQVLKDFLKIFNEQANVLNDTLESQADKLDFNMEEFISNYLYDTLSETLMGTKSNQYSQEEKMEFMYNIRKHTSILSYRFYQPWTYVDYIFQKTNAGKEYLSTIKSVHNIIKQYIHSKQKKMMSEETQTPDKNRNGKLKFKSFLEYVLQVGPANQLSERDIFDEIFTMFVAGLDTSATSMGYMCLILSRRFDLQEKILEEIEEVLGTREEIPVTYEHIQSFRYLDRFIKETLRVFPTVPYITRHVTEETELPSGTVPAGSGLIILVFPNHRNPDNYTDPNVFDPDNFLPEKVAERHPFSFFPFGAGLRGCIGQKYALIQLKVLAIYLLRRYWLTPSDFEPELTTTITMASRNGIHIGLKKRTPERPIVPDYYNLSKQIRTNVEFLNLEFKDCYL